MLTLVVCELVTELVAILFYHIENTNTNTPTHQHTNTTNLILIKTQLLVQTSRHVSTRFTMTRSKAAAQLKKPKRRITSKRVGRVAKKRRVGGVGGVSGISARRIAKPRLTRRTTRIKRTKRKPAKQTRLRGGLKPLQGGRAHVIVDGRQWLVAYTSSAQVVNAVLGDPDDVHAETPGNGLVNFLMANNYWAKGFMNTQYNPTNFAHEWDPRRAVTVGATLLPSRQEFQDALMEILDRLP